MRAEKKTPAALGYRMPAEWERQEAVWLSWPHNHQTWPGNFRPIPGVFARVAAEISFHEKVRINIAARLQKRALSLIARAGADMANVELYNHPTNDAWCRDHGPIFVRNDRTGEVAITDWKFNSWGGKYPPYGLDNRIPSQIARALMRWSFTNPMVLEGGSIDVNGKGLLLTTEACLLNPNRNPQLTRTQIKHNLRDYLGVKKVIWLGDGIEGDDTDGHVDDLARFFSDTGIVACFERDRRDVNYAALEENLGRLGELRTETGSRFTIAELPMPAPCYRRGKRLPASYANFLVINGAVLLPTFRQPRRDREAAVVLGSCFPGREVVPIDCLELVWGLGTLHCISQQQPAEIRK
jgi:agmatine deiminase